MFSCSDESDKTLMSNSNYVLLITIPKAKENEGSNGYVFLLEIRADEIKKNGVINVLYVF